MGFFDKFKKKETKIENEPEHFLYSEEALDRYEAFISEQFGEYEQVFHEIQIFIWTLLSFRRRKRTITINLSPWEWAHME